MLEFIFKLTIYSCDYFWDMGMGKKDKPGWLLVFFIWTAKPCSLLISECLGEQKIFPTKGNKSWLSLKNYPSFSQPSDYIWPTLLFVFSSPNIYEFMLRE